MSEPKWVDPSLPRTVLSLGGDEDRPSAVPAVESGAVLPSRPELGRYRILGLIGSGGMGNVYRALDTELDEVVALKVLRRELAEHHEVVERFRREVKLARRVTHRNVARVFDIGEAEGEKFITMELVDGPSLAERLAERRVLPLADALDLACAICDGLGAAHAAGVVHLDLKPGNVLLERGGRVVVTDFGISRALAEAGDADVAVGTPGYMAPEQVSGRADVDARADLYALGALIYEMVTGEPPWPGDSFVAIASSRLRAAPPDPRRVTASLPPAVTAVIQRAMAVRREERYASADEMADALDQLALRSSLVPSVSIPSSRRSNRGIPGPTPSEAGPARSNRRRVRELDKAVAVLPFRNSGPEVDAYVAEELTDDLVDVLSMTPGLRVSARAVVAGALRGREKSDPREIGRALGVQVVADGSVRRAEGRVRVTARLISVDEGFQLWARRFDRPAEEVLAINDEVARSIAGALTVEVERPARPAPPTAAAVDLFVRARNQYRRFWPENVTEAIVLLEEADALAPGDPAILGALALARTRLSHFVRDAIPAALEACRRAIAASAAQGEPRLALGSVLINEGSTVEAVRELRLAVALSPGAAEAHAALGRVLVEAGALDEGTRRLGAALDLDPEAPLALGSLLRVHAFVGDWDGARDLAERSRATDGDLGYLVNRARLALWERDVVSAAALRGSARALGIHGELPEALFRLVATGVGPADLPDLMALHAFPSASIRARAFLWQTQTEAAAFVGDTARALDALEQASACALFDRMWMDHCPTLQPLRAEPRFLRVATEVGQRAAAILAAYGAT